MRLLVYEYFSAGGGEGQGDLIAQGFAMLEALLKGFLVQEGLVLHIVLHTQLKNLWNSKSQGQNVNVHWAPSFEDTLRNYEKVLDKVDAVLIVAPESQGISCRLTRLAEDLRKQVLGSPSEAIGIAGNKNRCKEWLRARGISVPREIVLEEGFVSVEYPFVLKPVEGTGGHEVRLVANKEEAKEILHPYVHRYDSWEEFCKLYLFEEYILGETVSVSCLVADGKALPLTLNQQLLSFTKKVDFHGVQVGYHHQWEQEGKRIAQAACEAIPGLRGFVGVDLVLNEEGPVVIEVNPRVTLAYPPLQDLWQEEMASSLLDVCIKGRLPDLPLIHRDATFLIQETFSYQTSMPH